MDKQPAVVFRNVGQLYFPQTRVECHYSVSPDHQWSSSDWIGIFEVHSNIRHETKSSRSCVTEVLCTLVFVVVPQVGSSTVKEYHTYTWALVPESYTEGASINCCVIFQGKTAVRYFKE